MPRRTALARWEQLNSLVEEMGAGYAAAYAADRLLRRLSRDRVRLVCYRFVAQPLGAGASPRLRPDPKTTLARTAPNSPLVAAFPRPPEVIAARYAAGGQCLSAVTGEQFAGYVWWQHAHYDEDEVRCRYVLRAPAASVWDYDVYVAPRFRMGRTMARLWQEAEDHLVREGVRWSVSRISAFNAASLKSHARLGTVDCGSASFVVVGRWQFALLPQAPWLHLSWRDSQRPELLLGPL